MLRRRAIPLLAVAALGLPVAACGEDDVKNEVNQARDDIRQKADELQGNLDDLSRKDLQNALDDVEQAAKGGSADAKREARKLERKIERELKSR
jgi:uncharacterized protein YoxC